MRNIAREPSGGVPLTNALLNDFASGANKVFFRSSLMPCIKIRLTGEGVLYKQGKLGYTAYQMISLEHQQVHRAKIELDPIRDPPLQSNIRLQQRLLLMLIPELCYAQIAMFVERETLFVEDRLRVLGVDTAFAGLLKRIASVLRSHKMIDLNLQLYLRWMVWYNQEKQSNMFSLESYLSSQA
jgi:hypothetical protein